MKKFGVLLSFVAALMLVLIPFSSVSAKETINLTLDGEELTFDAAPTIVKGNTFIPIRVIAEEIGFDISWNNSARTATISNEELSITFAVDSSEVLVNGKTEKINAPTFINQSRLFVPLRFIMEHNGLEVEWDNATRTVHLHSSNLVENFDEVLEKLFAVELKSFSSDMTMKQTMTVNGDTMEMIAKATQDVVVDPFGIYQKMEMSMLGEEMEIEMYMTEDGFYMFEPMEGQWIQFDNSLFGDMSELLDMANMSNDPVTQLELLQEYISDISIYDRGSYYVMNYSIDSEGYDKLLQDMLGSFIPLEDEIMPGLTFDKMQFSISYDKETYYPTSFSSNTELTIDMGEEKMHMIQKMYGSYKNINSLKEIKIPRDIIENAVKM